MKISLSFIFLCFSYSFLASANAPLPTPIGLESTVKFWEDIFTKYSPDQCVFHDEKNLNVIYLVKDVPLTRANKRNRSVSRYVKGIELTLKKFASGSMPRDEFEKLVYNRVPIPMRTKTFFATAATQVRCQRGVDLSSSLERSKNYIPMIKNVLRRKNLPEDLAYLPHLESGFNPNAHSKRGAVGLWQFMAQTARSEGLTISRRKDWRRDPTAATDAATDHIASIFMQTKSWPLTITAYNYGENGTRRAIEKFGNDYMTIHTEHETSVFRFAARNYYPSFLAVRNVTQKYEGSIATNSSSDKKRRLR